MSDSELASKNPLRAMRFTKRFPSSSVGVLQIAAASDRLPTIDFPCSDPQPPFEDIINWIKEALCDMVSPVRPPRPIYRDLPRRSLRVLDFCSTSAAPMCSEGKRPVARGSFRICELHVISPRRGLRSRDMAAAS
jgi:hypothetical protein